MKTRSKNIALLGAGLLCVTSLFAADPQAPKAEKSSKVASVEAVTVEAAEGAPGRLTIKAAGMVNTGGWTKPMLRPVENAADAKAGTLVFEFVATRPTGPATMAFAPIKASITVDKPAGYSGVEIVAQTNRKAAK